MTELYRGRVKHDANGGTERLGREVGPELGTDGTAVAVWPGDLAPDDTDLGALNSPLSTVDVCKAVNFHLAIAGPDAQMYVHATRLPQYHCAAAVSSTPSSFNSEVPGLVLRFLHFVSDELYACRRIGRTLAGSCGLLAMLSTLSQTLAHLRNVLSLDVEAVGLLRHGERLWPPDCVWKVKETVGRGVAAG